MGKIRCNLTVYFEEPFWVGVFEVIENHKISSLTGSMRRCRSNPTVYSITGLLFSQDSTPVFA